MNLKKKKSDIKYKVSPVCSQKHGKKGRERERVGKGKVIEEYNRRGIEKQKIVYICFSVLSLFFVSSFFFF